VTAGPLLLHAAGSLRAALGEVADAFRGAGGAPVVGEFGASGLLRARIEAGEPSDVFASADMGHARALAATQGGAEVRAFAANRLVAVARGRLGLTPESLLAAMLDPGVALATSTPRADPCGDYAEAMFRRAEALRRGAAAALSAKARRVMGGAGSPRAPEGRDTYAWPFERGAADILLTYATNAPRALAALPPGALAVVEPPPALAVRALYGLAALPPRSEAREFARFLSGAAGQSVLMRHGFAAAHNDTGETET